MTSMENKCDVSILIPIYNGEPWINDCFDSIINQTALKELKIEVCICNDASTDNTENLLKRWKNKFENNDTLFTVYKNEGDSPKGVGYGKNRAFEISSGHYLCFQDVDDVMLPDRIMKQYQQLKLLGNNILLGAQFKRIPPESTLRYTKWANQLTKTQLNSQIYTSNGPTIIMPTWFCHRSVFEKVGGFSEEGKGTPEDFIFFYKHLETGGTISRINEVLLLYRYHPEATTFTIKEETIWKIRLERLQQNVLTKWKNFTIWNAGKQGRKFYKTLSKENQNKVKGFCDVDEKKIGTFYEPFDEISRTVGQKIPIFSFSIAEKPFIICVKLDLTEGQFEENLQSLNLKEGDDFVFFS